MSPYRLRYIHVYACTRNVVATSIRTCIWQTLYITNRLTLDECHVVSWSDKCT